VIDTVATATVGHIFHWIARSKGVLNKCGVRSHDFSKRLQVAADPSVPHSLASPAAEHSAPAAEGAGAVASSEDVMAIVSRTAGRGVPAVLELMKENAVDSVHQWWCCDAIAGLCAGNGEASLDPGFRNASSAERNGHSEGVTLLWRQWEAAAFE